MNSTNDLEDLMKNNGPEVDTDKVPSILTTMGFKGVDANKVETISRNNFGTVYLCGNLAIKINGFKSCSSQLFYANKVASEALGKRSRPGSKVVQILEYDIF